MGFFEICFTAFKMMAAAVIVPVVTLAIGYVLGAGVLWAAGKIREKVKKV